MSSGSPSKPSAALQRSSRKRSRRGLGDFSSPVEEDGDFEPGLSPRSSKLWKEGGSGLRRSNRHAAVKLSFSSPSKSTVTAVGTKLKHLLSLPKAYRWCCCEWFYSDIDRAILGGDNDFSKYLHEAFPSIYTRQLTRCEWSQIRKLMGKPRRCSSQFFAEERHTLQRQRTKIRLLQRREVTEEDLMHFKDVPEEIPPPLVLGTKVTAWLRGTNNHGLLTGHVEAVDLMNGQYHITFDRPGVTSGSVPDIDIMSSDDIDTLPVSSFLQPQRRALSWFSLSTVTPPSHFSTPLTSQSAYWKSDPLIGASPAGPKMSETLGGFPVRFLKLVVRLSKILGIKKERIERLSEMNTQGEKLLSFGESFIPEFQAQYASSVLDLDRLNKNLSVCLQDVQEYMPKVSGCDGVADGGNVAVNEICTEEAEQMVAGICSEDSGSSVKSEHLKQLVVGLTSLLLQVQMLSERPSLPSHELQRLAESISYLKLNKIDPSNTKVFEDKVEVHMTHIEAGLSQLGNLKAFEMRL